MFRCEVSFLHHALARGHSLRAVGRLRRHSPLRPSGHTWRRSGVSGIRRPSDEFGTENAVLTAESPFALSVSLFRRTCANPSETEKPRPVLAFSTGPKSSRIGSRGVGDDAFETESRAARPAGKGAPDAVHFGRRDAILARRRRLQVQTLVARRNHYPTDAQRQSERQGRSIPPFTANASHTTLTTDNQGQRVLAPSRRS
jgi:hypothetical protein